MDRNTGDKDTLVVNDHLQYRVDEEPIHSNNGAEDTNVAAASLHTPTVYRRRWYILLMFSTVGAIQGLAGNSFGPLADSVSYAFHWSDHQLALIQNFMPITFLLATPLFSWLMDVKGLRCSIISRLYFSRIPFFFNYFIR